MKPTDGIMQSLNRDYHTAILEVHKTSMHAPSQYHSVGIRDHLSERLRIETCIRPVARHLDNDGCHVVLSTVNQFRTKWHRQSSHRLSEPQQICLIVSFEPVKLDLIHSQLNQQPCNYDDQDDKGCC